MAESLQHIHLHKYVAILIKPKEILAQFCDFENARCLKIKSDIKKFPQRGFQRILDMLFYEKFAF